MIGRNGRCDVIGIGAFTRPSVHGCQRSTGRTVAIAANERLQHRLRKLQKTPTDRAKLRGRVAV